MSWLALLGSVISMSSTGPLFLFLQREGVPPILACVWRNHATCLFLIAPAVWEWYKNKKGKRRMKTAAQPAGTTAVNSPLMSNNENSTTSSDPSRSSELDFVRMSPDAELGLADGTTSSGGNSGSSSRESTTPSSRPSEDAGLLSSDTVIGTRTNAAELAATKLRNKMEQGRKKQLRVALYMIAVSVEWTGSLVLWVVSLPWTTTARASLLTSTYPLLLLAWLKWGPSKTHISKGEVAGILVSLAGICLSEATAMFASGEVNTEESVETKLMLLGDTLCVVSAVFLAADIVLSEKARKVTKRRQLLLVFKYG
jgi:hypothetical protein